MKTIAIGRGNYEALEDDDCRPLVRDPDGAVREAYDGEKFFLSWNDEDVLHATVYGWKPDDEFVVCRGARIP